MLLLFPKDPLSGQVDPHYAAELAAAKELTLATALVDDALLRAGDSTAAVAAVPAADDLVYRGWMLSAAEYGQLEEALAGKGAYLRTQRGDYQRAHELPGWQQAFSALSAESRWLTTSPGRLPDGFAALLASFHEGPLLLKDYVKSEKHYWNEACYIPDGSDLAAATRVAERFLELRGDDLVGGLVLHRFEHYRGAEARSWWVDGHLALVSAHPDSPEELPALADDLTAVAAAVATLGCPFVTVDLVRRDDGVLRVVEVGDGQVSDRPTSTAARDLLAALNRR